MKNKKLLTAGVSLAGVATLGLGAFAFFSDMAESEVNGTVGSVDVELKNLNVSHTYKGEEAPDNLNPGDGFYTDDKREGTDHEISYTVENLGSKSIITRHVVKVSGTDINGDPLSVEDLKKIRLWEQGDNSSIGVMTEEENAVVHVYGGSRNEDVLDGVGKNAEKENITNGATSYDRGFIYGLECDVNGENSKLEGATITFNIKVEAMQYRNTGDQDWVEIFGENIDTNVGLN